MDHASGENEKEETRNGFKCVNRFTCSRNVSLFFLTICVILLPIFLVVFLVENLPETIPSPFEQQDGWGILEGWGPNVSTDLRKYVLPGTRTTVLHPKWSCGQHSPYLLVIVCSALDHFDQRAAIRETWGSVREVLNETVRLAFLIGTPRPDSISREVQTTLDESNRHGDIIQEPFVDTYNNLTLKSVFLLKWVLNMCTGARFILKSDDDMFVDVRSLVLLLLGFERERAPVNRERVALPETLNLTNGHEPLLLGALVRDSTPERNFYNKYYSPWYMYTKLKYPDYLFGGGYVLSANAIAQLYKGAFLVRFFYLEDVFITGICAHQARIKLTDHPAFNNKRLILDPCLLRDRSVVISPIVDAVTLRKIWTGINQPNLHC